MRCETAQRALSESLDERAAVSDDVRHHADSCPACTEFAGSSWRLRDLVRFEVAPPVPDLVPAIMARVRREEAPEARPARPRWARPRLVRPLWQPVAAAALAGLLVGAATTAGGLFAPRRTNTAALAETIPHQLLRAAVTLRGYRATFDITELHWSRAVPRRTFVADLAFRAPEDFHVQVRDTTRYPSAAWPANDLLLVTDGHAWRASGPDACTAAELPACPSAEPVTVSTIGRAPFDPRTAMPTDVIVPMTVLAAADRVDVIGPDQVDGRAAVAIELSYEDAAPLFDYLRFLGSWRPFYPRDRVVVWLDRQTWFPLRYEVFPAGGAERAAWASGEGLPPERPGGPVFTATERSLATTPAPAAVFEVSQAAGAREEGFHDLPLGSGSARPTQPSSTAGLSFWRYGRFARSASRPFDESVVSYSKGLAWLTVTRVLAWNQRSLFGVGSFAERVALPGSHGVAYFEPATRTDPRRLALHTEVGEFLVRSNLPRKEVLAVAGSLPVTGLPEPAAWRIARWSGGLVEHGLTPAQAMAAAGFPALVPSYLPPGVRAVAAQIERTEGSKGITVVFRRPAADLEGDGIQIHQALGGALPPPSGADQLVVPVRGVLGRWSPQAHLLEWVDHGIYRSVRAPGLDLGWILRVANSLTAPPGGSA